jgi:type II secretory ATPase GspE/PulE/Tfp pilus assembly ATPase PilB-like protein
MELERPASLPPLDDSDDPLDALLRFGVKQRASDIHFEPYQDSYRFRLRIDGYLIPFSWPGQDLSEPEYSKLLIRIKNLAGMDIAERRKPQDGSFTWKLPDDRKVDVRVSCMPTVEGEKIVLRLLGADRQRWTLEQLGMDAETLQQFRDMLQVPYGMLLVTGPTGSGKSTTLYAAMQTLNDPRVHIVALEDPIEYTIQGVTQIEINTRTGLTFATGLRSILRQDPNIIMIGEIRDRETAEIAIRAALTGHRVFSTLHTSDTVQAIVRLLDMGLEPYLVASALTGVVAQRLLRRVCEVCHGSAANCLHCNGTGYYGRIGVFEILPLSKDMKRLIAKGGTEDELRTLAMQEGVKTLRDVMEAYAREGITDFQEVARWSFARV